MKLSDLPDIVFVDASVATVQTEVFAIYKEVTGRTPAKGDPVRLFLLTMTYIFVLLLNCINETGKQNLLRYAEEYKLDHIGALVGCDRIPAAAAVTTIKVTLSEEQSVSTIIPAGTRFTAGDGVFFALDNTMVIAAGDTDGSGSATCTVTGTDGNDYPVGTIKTLVDPIPYVASVENTTVSEGGAGTQEDDDYREAIHEKPESFSTAGPTGAYEFHAKQASALISDVSVISPTPGAVAVRPLLEGGEIPGTEILNMVAAHLNTRTIRPLTDNVSVLAPTAVSYDVEITYYIDSADATMASTIQAAVTAAVDNYVAWQKEKLGRDINPSELIRLVMQAGAKRVTVTAPVFTALDKTQVAIADEVTVNMGGFEDE